MSAGPPSRFAALLTWIFVHRRVVALAMVLALLGADQATKLLVLHNMATPRPLEATAQIDPGVVHYRASRELQPIRGIFHIRYVENLGSAFGLSNWVPLWLRRPILTGGNLVAGLAFLLWLMFWLKQPDGLSVLALASVSTGALGNGIDRAWHGFVIDFIDWRLTRFFPDLVPWPTFNIADSCIVCGAALIILRAFIPFKDPAASAA